MQLFRSIRILLLLLVLFSSVACDKFSNKMILGNAGSRLHAEIFGEFNEPWAMTFLPSGDLLITEKSGSLLLVSLKDVS